MSGWLRRAILAFWLVFGSLMASSDAAIAWTSATRLSMAEWALRVTPPDLERQILRHKRRFREGMLAAAQGHQGAGIRLRNLIPREADRAVTAITQHQPFREIVFQLGVVAHCVASANDPLWAESADRAESYRRDYSHYLEDASRRFAVLYYGYGRQFETPEELDALIRRTLRRSQLLAPMVAQEYERIGAIDGMTLFDDRSTAFGVGALAFSHGISDIAGVLRYIWLRAGGTDSRRWPSLDEDHLILVGHGAQAQRAGG